MLNPVKKHSKAWAFFAVSKQIPVVYSVDRGLAIIIKYLGEQILALGCLKGKA